MPSIGSDTNRPGASTPAPYCRVASSNSASGLNENFASTSIASMNAPRQQQHRLDDLHPGRGDHAAEQHVGEHHQADDHDRDFVVEAEQQPDQVAGADHLRDQIERDDREAAGRGRDAHRRLPQAERDDVAEGELAEVAQRLGDQAHHDRPADQEADRVNQAVESRQRDQAGDAEEAGGAHVVAGERQAVLQRGDRSAGRVEVLGAARPCAPRTR